MNEGIADAETIDTVVKYSLGRRWNLVGPVASADLGGLDTFYNVSTYLLKDMDNGTEPSPLLEAKVQAGDLGPKPVGASTSGPARPGRRSFANVMRT